MKLLDNQFLSGPYKQQLHKLSYLSNVRQEKLWRYRNDDLLWPLARYYDRLLILPPCDGTLRVYYHELRDLMVHSVTFVMFAR